MVDSAELNSNPYKYSDDELKESYSGPAIYADRFMVMVGSMIKIAFLEQDATEKAHFRAAVVLSASDALALSQLLRDALELPGESAKSPFQSEQK